MSNRFQLKHTEKQFEKYRQFWEFIEEYLPEYSRRDDVLQSDILLRFLTDDEVSKEDLEWIERDFRSDKALVRQELVCLETKFTKEALTDFYDRI